MLVSVIIPAYNSEKYITSTLDSVLAQTYKNLEVIVVDDGSTDGTVEVVREYEQAGIICLTQKNKGACAARNFGYAHATGDFIQFLDADDIIAPNKIEYQLKQLLATENYQDKLIHCQWGRFYDGNIDKVDWWGPHESIRCNLKPADWLIANHMSNTHCWLIPRNLIEKAGSWDESLKKNQDGEFFSRLMTHTDEVLFSDDAKVYYRSGNAGSISNTRTRSAMKSLLQSLFSIEESIFKLEKSARANLSVANMYQDFVYANYIANPDLAAIAEEKVKELGGADLKLQGGIVLRFLSTYLGWKNALRIKRTFFSGTRL